MTVSRFPNTRVSAIAAMASEDEGVRSDAFGTIVRAYWAPVYKYIRLKWNRSAEDAQDLTQSFFSEALEKNYFARYDPARAKFRTFLRTCLDRYIANADKSSARMKRGGQTVFISLDFYAAEAQVAMHNPSTSPEALFEQEWVRSLFAQAVDDLEVCLREEGKSLYFRAFEMYALDDEKRSYKEVAEELGISVGDVTNYLSYARRALRRILTGMLGRLSPTEEEYRREAKTLFGL